MEKKRRTSVEFKRSSSKQRSVNIIVVWQWVGRQLFMFCSLQRCWAVSFSRIGRFLECIIIPYMQDWKEKRHSYWFGTVRGIRWIRFYFRFFSHVFIPIVEPIRNWCNQHALELLENIELIRLQNHHFTEIMWLKHQSQDRISIHMALIAIPMEISFDFRNWDIFRGKNRCIWLRRWKKTTFDLQSVNPFHI